METMLKRITINPEQCGGQPCIRGMRIRAVDILDLLSSGLTAEEIIIELPDLEPDDIKAVIFFARNRINHPMVAL